MHRDRQCAAPCRTQKPNHPPKSSSTLSEGLNISTKMGQRSAHCQRFQVHVLFAIIKATSDPTISKQSPDNSGYLNVKAIRIASVPGLAALFTSAIDSTIRGPFLSVATVSSLCAITIVTRSSAPMRAARTAVLTLKFSKNL